MIKNLQIKFPNGDTFLVPALVVGRSLAKYRFERDDIMTEQDYLEEVMVDCYDLCDWLKNSMDWKDVEFVAIKIEREPYNYHAGFNEATTSCILGD